MSEKTKSRSTALFFLVFFSFCGLAWQLFQIQIIEGPNLAYKALEQRTQRFNLSFPRSTIYDIQEKPLTERETISSLVVFPQVIKDKSKVAKVLASLLDLDEKDILLKLNSNSYPFRIGETLNPEIVSYLQKLNLTGLLVLDEKKRYQDRQLAAHLLGYINRIDNRGVSGLEKALDPFLKKEVSESVAISMDAHKNLIMGLGIKQQKIPKELQGKKIVLTLDYRWQKIVEDVMDKEVKKGAVVVMNPYTGAILAMASRPDFNPNRVADFFQQGNAALLNRALVGYPPGSIFKIVTASAALQENTVHINQKFYCPGYIMIGKLKISCHEKKGHGELDLVQAFAQSCNPAFITVGLSLGSEKLLSYAQKFGLGQATGIGLSEERQGKLPKLPLYSGDLANLSIGQGCLEVTPLQAAVMLSSIVNDGKRIEPYLVEKIIDGQDRIIKRHKESKTVSVVSPMTAEQVRLMLETVTQTGTGRAAYIERYGSGGKTGSAQTGKANGQGEELSHAWFVGYAPSKEKPRWVISVFVEEGNSGGGVAAPVFAKIAQRALQESL